MITETKLADAKLMIVDENDRPLDNPPPDVPVFYRGVAVLVINPKEEILLHRPRSETGTTFLPWKSSCYGAVLKGEDYRAAAVRVFKEFFGQDIHPFKLESLDYARPCPDNGNRFIHGYLLRTNGEVEYIKNVPAEVTWFRPSDIQSAVVARKMSLSPALEHTLKNYLRLQEYKRKRNSALHTSLNSERHFRLIES